MWERTTNARRMRAKYRGEMGCKIFLLFAKCTAQRPGDIVVLSGVESDFFFVRFFVCCCGVFGARCHRMEIVFRVCSQHTHTHTETNFIRSTKCEIVRNETDLTSSFRVCFAFVVVFVETTDEAPQPHTIYAYVSLAIESSAYSVYFFFHFYFFGSAITLSTDNICRWFMPYFYNIHQNCRRWLCGMCSMRGTWGGEANTEYNVYIAGWNCRAAAEYLIGEFSTKSMIVMWRASWLLKSIYSANIVVEALDFRGVSAEICNFLHISTNQAVPLISHLDSSTQIAHHHIPPGRVCAFCSHAVLHLTFVVRASTTQFCSVCNCLFTYCYYYMWIISTSIIYTNTKRCYYGYNCVRPVWCCSITCTTYMNLTQRKTKKKPSYTHHTHRNEWYLW